jgi:psp operon transcriptional activator
LDLQEKILRVLEYGEFERVGGSETIKVDVRIVAATNRDLPSMCRRGKFKEDLLDRLSFEVITLPPLRYRREDIPIMVTHFANRMSMELELDQHPNFSEQAMQDLINHDWPGNVRELKNTVERAVYECDEDVIDDVVLNPFESPYRPKDEAVRSGSAARLLETAPERDVDTDADAEREPMQTADFLFEFPIDLQNKVAEFEARIVNQAMEASKFNQRKAAEYLGLSYYQLRRLLKKVDSED